MCWYFCGKLISFRTHFLRLCFFRSIHHHHHRIYNLFTLHFVMKHFLFLSESWRSDDDDDDDELRKDRNLKRKRFNDFWIFFINRKRKQNIFLFSIQFEYIEFDIFFGLLNDESLILKLQYIMYLFSKLNLTDQSTLFFELSSKHGKEKICSKKILDLIPDFFPRRTQNHEICGIRLTEK